MFRVIGLVVALVLVAAGVGVWQYYTGEPPQFVPKAAVKSGGEAPIDPPKAELPAGPIILHKSEKVIDGFPETITVTQGDDSFATEYMGQMRRNKKIVVTINTYDIACYTVDPKQGETNALLDDLLVEGEAKVYMLRFISRLTGKMIVSDIHKEIDKTFGDVDVNRLADNINSFCQQFAPGSTPGDVVYLVWLPGGRVYCGFNKAENLDFIGQDVPFARAIWRIWAGVQRGPDRVRLVSRFAEHSDVR